MSERLTFHINTKDRPEHLVCALTSLWGQTYQDWDVIIQDGGEPMATQHEAVRQILGLIRRFGHEATYIKDEVPGIPQAYQRMMEMSQTEFCYRSEDDMCMEPETIKYLMDELLKDDKIAAAAPMTPDWQGATTLPAPNELGNGFHKANQQETAPGQPFIYEACDQQGFVIPNVKPGGRVYDVDVIHAGSLYRKDAATKVGGFASHFTETGHREESWFYTKLRVEGEYRLIVVPWARSWHFQAEFGGSRPDGAVAPKRIENRRYDEALFQKDFKRWMKMAKEQGRPLKMLDE